MVNAVTLEVTPEQAEKIDLARSVGTLSLVLRNQIDPQASETTGATKTSLLQQAAEPLLETKQVQTGTRHQAPSNHPRRAAKPASRKSSTAAKESDQVVASTATAAAAKSSSPPTVASSMACVGVINGLRNGQECY